MRPKENIRFLTPHFAVGVGPAHTQKLAQQGYLTIVFDVLRAGATLYALMEFQVNLPIWLVHDVGDCHGIKLDEYPDALLIGERHFDRPKGFDYGNSPVEIEKESPTLQNATIIYTSTSGVASMVSGLPHSTLLGSLTNLPTLRNYLAKEMTKNQPIALIASQGSWTENPFQYEDCIAILFLVTSLAPETLPQLLHTNDVKKASELPSTWDWFRILLSTTHGKRLASAGYLEDIDWINNHFGRHRIIAGLVSHSKNISGRRMALSTIFSETPLHKPIESDT